ncbi:NAD(P)H-dependent oxidoreductase [Amycolatopsis sp. H20-H5]|uniref:NAD(P)H-dependent oxidoreductase n=1 Tax=Amycolatopsis sp. H20-H5 TaxID=3046309 RepID=UPI002DB5C4A7|nr:NAD(P)H-dependent oxidoreductase [Amycolatopsis sp. H20-H5]MEC3978107.1 NAD(P)H-dependent oxidoreductase [Amycolatopsis sp. H20-H5]
MKALWIFAHPEQRSLSGALRDEGLRTLRGQGHEVRESDLYAMDWKPVVDSADFGAAANGRLFVGPTSKDAYRDGELSEDIVAEHGKLDWADTVILQFPLWWYGMPAILKGWFDRVFVNGFGYGVTHPDGHTLRYGEGRLAGKRAMVIVTAGAPAVTMGPHGVNGELNDLLFPLQHGTLFYAGMSVLPPLAVYGANRVSPGEYEAAATRLRDRLHTLRTTTPLPFRFQNHGDYDENLVLREELTCGNTGLDVHYTRA